MKKEKKLEKIAKKIAELENKMATGKDRPNSGFGSQ